MPGAGFGPDLHEQLEHWVAQGLLEADQAARIEAAEVAEVAEAPEVAEAAKAPAAPETADAAKAAGATRVSGPAHEISARRALVIEALGYLGGALAIVAGFIAVRQLWPDIPASAQLIFAAVAAIALGVAGAVTRTGGDPAFGRLRSVLWLLSTASAGAFAGVLAAQVWHFSGVSTALSVACAVTVYSVVLWWRDRAPLQHLAMFAGAAAVAGTAVARFGPGLGIWAAGLAVWALSLLWGIAAYRGYLDPQTAGYVAAGVGLLVGATMTMELAAGNALAMTTVAGLLAAGVVLRRVLLLAIGAIGVIEVVPQTAVRYLPPSVGAPLAVLVVGLVLLGAALWLAKSGKRRDRSGSAGGNGDRHARP